METTRQIVHCPNCGCLAERNYHRLSSHIETQCLVCDYLMVICANTGRVIESYFPGSYPHQLSHCSQLTVNSLSSLSRKKTVR